MEVSKQFLMSEIPLFDDLTPEECDQLQARLLVRKLNKGDIVYKQGTSGKSVCFVLDGELTVVKRSEDSDVVLASRSKGESVGEMALIDGLARSADVVAAKETTVLALRQNDFEELVKDNAGIAFKLMRALAKSLTLSIRDRADHHS